MTQNIPTICEVLFNRSPTLAFTSSGAHQNFYIKCDKMWELKPFPKAPKIHLAIGKKLHKSWANSQRLKAAPPVICWHVHIGSELFTPCYWLSSSVVTNELCYLQHPGKKTGTPVLKDTTHQQHKTLLQAYARFLEVKTKVFSQSILNTMEL